MCHPKEVVQHATFAVNKAQLYCGQEGILGKLFKRFSDKVNTQPLILYGESGVGKTATVAKLIQETWKNVDGPPNVIYRFLGITPASSSIDMLFWSLSQQICELYGLKLHGHKEDDFNLLRPYFFELLEQVSKAGDDKKNLIIILDSLDQLSPAYGAHLMNWLPDNLPNRVKLLLTVMPYYQNILTRLQARLKPSNFVELTQLSNETATDVLRKLLEKSSRTLQPHQMKLVESVFREAQTPLLLHLTVIEARQWHSFTPEDQLKLGSSIREAIHILFERLEKNHGEVLVSHALSCLVSAKNGLTEIEMEEILSLDNEVLDDVYQYWAPPSDSEIRIPPLVFARLKQEMSDFIMGRKGDDMTVMGLYHKQFTEVILQRYLSSIEIRENIHKNLAEFFLGDWFNKPKPISLKVFNGQSYSLLRRVSNQPLRYGDNSNGRYNLRKLNELPQHLAKSHDFLRAKAEVFGNFEFLLMKIDACGIPAVLADFDLYLNEEEVPEASISAIKQCIRLAKTTLEYKGNENLFPAELLGRMSRLARDHPPVLQPLLNQAKEWCMTKYPESTIVIPQNQCFMAPSGTLVANILGHTGGIIDVACTEDRKVLVTASKDKTVRIWDLDTDTVIHIIDQRVLPEKLTICDVQGRVLVLNALGGLGIYDIKAGNLLYHLEPKELQNSKNLEELCITGQNKSALKESFNRSNHSAAFCFLFDRILAAGKDRDIYLVDVSENPKVLKRIQIDMNINFARCQSNMLLIGLGANCELCLNPRDISCSIVTYKRVSQILGSSFIAPGQSCLISVVNIEKKASIIIDMIANKTDIVKKEPLTIADKPALFCDFLKNTVAVATEDNVIVYELPDQVEWSKNGGKFKTVFSTMLPPENHHRSNSMFGSIMQADLQHNICLLRLVNPGSGTLLVVGCNNETIRLYDVKSQKIRGLLSGLWGRPTIVTSVGSHLYTSSYSVPNVKVWDLNSKNENDTQVVIESFTIPPTCWAQKGEFVMCSVTPDCRHVCISTIEGLQKRLKVSHHHEIHGMLHLVGKDTLIFADKKGHIHESVLSQCLMPNSHKLHSKVVAKLGSKVTKWSADRGQNIMVILLENHQQMKLELSNHSTSEILTSSDPPVKRKALDLCLTKHGVVEFCKDGATFLQTFSGKVSFNFDWPAQNCRIFCTKGDYFAALIESPQTREQVIEIWNLNSGNRHCTINSRSLPVTCMDLTNDGEFLLVGMGNNPDDSSAQRQIRIFRVSDGSIERKSFYLYSTVSGIVCFEDNYFGAMLDLGYFGFFKLKPAEHRFLEKREKREEVKATKKKSLIPADIAVHGANGQISAVNETDEKISQSSSKAGSAKLRQRRSAACRIL